MKPTRKTTAKSLPADLNGTNGRNGKTHHAVAPLAPASPRSPRAKALRVQAPKKTGQEVAALREQLEAFHRTQAVIEFDMEGDVLSANANFIKLMGMTADDVAVGQKVLRALRRGDTLTGGPNGRWL